MIYPQVIENKYLFAIFNTLDVDEFYTENNLVVFIKTQNKCTHSVSPYLSHGTLNQVRLRVPRRNLDVATNFSIIV